MSGRQGRRGATARRKPLHVLFDSLEPDRARRRALRIAAALVLAAWGSHETALLAQTATPALAESKRALSKKEAWAAYAKVHAAWNSEDVAERRRIAAEILDENIEYQTVRHDTVFGRQTVIDDMAVFHNRFPGGHFEIGDVSVHHNVALLTWVIIQADGTEFARGGDMITVGANGKITKITTFGPASKSPD